ncbi:MAG: hypothetical protein JXR56_07610 [Candidatus Cloacimonetes bacterium]|nr:hypothetical protein [Candidatus Cloacimonadota bacterium]
MNKFLLFLKHEFKVNKTAFMIPFIIQGINIALSLIILLLVASKLIPANGTLDEGLNQLFSEINVGIDSELSGVVLMIIGYIMTSISVTIYGVLVGMIRAGSVLNYEIRMGYELFYRSLPISIWSRSVAKYLNSIVGAFLAAIGVAIVNYIFASCMFSTVFADNGLVWTMLFQGMLAGFISTIFAAFLFGSIGFLLSAVFTKMALLKGAFILLITGFVELLLKAFGIKFLPLFSYLTGSIAKLLRPTSMVMTSIENTKDIQNLTHIPLTNFFHTEQIWIVLISCGLFALSTIIYKYKTLDA